MINITYTSEELAAIVAQYRVKYGSRIQWEVILQNVKTFVENRDQILTNSLVQWHGFLHYLSSIEKTIGLFGYASKGSFHRIFVKFGRAYLEEKEIIDSDAGQEMRMHWIQNDNMYFKEGDGQKGDIDLQDANGLTYDVKNDYINFYDIKNDYVNFAKAHGADFLLKYRSLDGWVELHKKPAAEGLGSYVAAFAACRPLNKIAISRGLNPLLFDKDSSEEEIERYLGLID